MSYFVDILNGGEKFFLPGCSQVFSLLNVKFKSISELNKSPVQREKFSYK